MKKPKLYSLTVTEAQLVVMQIAAEWFLRLQMGQFFDYANEIARCGYVYDKSNPDNERLFDEYIQRRDESLSAMQTAFRIAQPMICNKTEDMLIAEDIWVEIRHFLWKERPEPKPHDTTDASPPMLFSGQPSMVIRRDGRATAAALEIAELKHQHLLDQAEIVRLRRMVESAESDKKS